MTTLITMMWRGVQNALSILFVRDSSQKDDDGAGRRVIKRSPAAIALLAMFYSIKDKVRVSFFISYIFWPSLLGLKWVFCFWGFM
jgi:hypothetical protein